MGSINLKEYLSNPHKKLVTLRHFHSTAQEFNAKVEKIDLETNGEYRNDEKLIRQLKDEYAERVGQEIFATLSVEGNDFYQKHVNHYKSLLKDLLSEPLTIQTSPYARCIETLSLIIREYDKDIGEALLNSRQEMFELEIQGVPVKIFINDLLVERNMGNIVYPSSLLPLNPMDPDDQLTLPQKQKLWYYNRVNGGESMIDVRRRCLLLIQEFLDNNENQLRISHTLLLNQLINTMQKGSYYGYADEDNRHIKNGSISVIEQHGKTLIPKIVGHVLASDSLLV